MAAAKGTRPPNAGKGRKAGVPNKITRTVKEAFEAAFREAQGVDGIKLTDWMKKEPTEFYKIAAKLIPSELKGEMTHNHKVPSLEMVEAAIGIKRDD